MPKYYKAREEEDSEAEPGFLIYNPPRPTDEAIIAEKFIKDNNLQHGDIVNFEEYRYSFAYIVNLAPSRFHLIKNPDDSGSGYLTIPAQVLEAFPDALGSYSDIIKSVSGVVNLHLSGADKYIQDKLDGEVPADWEFDIHLVEGTIENFYVRKPGQVWKEFDVQTVTQQEIQAAWGSENAAEAIVQVRVALEGDLLLKYKDQNRGFGVGENAWRKAKPKLPSHWSISQLSANTGPQFSDWVWEMRGPAEKLNETQEAVANFLKGFPYKKNIIAKVNQ